MTNDIFMEHLVFSLEWLSALKWNFPFKNEKTEHWKVIWIFLQSNVTNEPFFTLPICWKIFLTGHSKQIFFQNIDTLNNFHRVFLFLPSSVRTSYFVIIFFYAVCDKFQSSRYSWFLINCFTTPGYKKCHKYKWNVNWYTAFYLYSRGKKKKKRKFELWVANSTFL